MFGTTAWQDAQELLQKDIKTKSQSLLVSLFSLTLGITQGFLLSLLLPKYL